MALIELGDVSSGSPPGSPFPRCRAHLRRRVVAAVAVLCVLTVTGSARPEPRSLPTLWRMPAGAAQFTLTADSVYLLDQRASVLRAYAAADGAPRWTRQLRAPAGWVNSEVPGTLLVPSLSAGILDGGAGNPLPSAVDTVAVDAATGAVRWRQPGEASLGTPDVIVLAQWDNVEGLRSLRGVRTTDGAQMWTYRAEGTVASWTVTGAVRGRPDRLVTVTATGRLQVRRLVDGTAVAETAVRGLAGAPREHADYYVFGSGPHLFVVRTDDGRATTTAYDPETLRPSWERTGPGPLGIFGCGGLLCVGDASGAIDVRDLRTGELRWHGGGWDTARPVGDGTLLLESGGSRRHSLVDERTGRVLADFDGGTAVVDPVAGTMLSLRLARSLPLRLTVRQHRDGEVILRGAVAPAGDQGCQLAAERLACAAADGTLTVTDVG